jgi:hypothetical protein
LIASQSYGHIDSDSSELSLIQVDTYPAPERHAPLITTAPAPVPAIIPPVEHVHHEQSAASLPPRHLSYMVSAPVEVRAQPVMLPLKQVASHPSGMFLCLPTFFLLR